MLADKGLPTLASILMIVGYRTRVASVAYTFVMVVAFLMAHTDNFFALEKSGAWAHEGIALFLLGGLGLFFTGDGKHAFSSKHAWD